MRRWLGMAMILAAMVGAGCGGKNSFVRVDDVALGRVVVYRNGVAYYERRATVEGRELRVTVPRDKVDDFLKSLTVTDAKTGKALPVVFPRQQADYGAFIEMALELPDAGPTDVVLTYVTEAPAWKPSYREVVGDQGKVMFEGWAIVDNTSGEAWKNVIVGVGSSSALSFRYDLWSVRVVERETLQSEARFAVAPPTAVSPYDDQTRVAGGAAAAGAVLGQLGDEELRLPPGHPGTGTVVATGSASVASVETQALGAAPAEIEESIEYATADSEGGGGGGRRSGYSLSSRGESKPRRAKAPAEPPAPAPPPNRWQMGDAKVKSVADQLMSGRKRVAIEGYAAPGEPDAEKRALDRANVVRNQLIDAGVPPAQLQVVARGYVAGNGAGVRLVDAGALDGTGAAGPAAGNGAAAAGARPTGAEAPVGESHFQSDGPMTVGAGTSVMVSMVRDETEGEVVYLYDADSDRGNDRFAFRAVRLRNPTDSTLDPGPVTVYGEGRFIGEGLTEPIPPHAAIVVPFALDRQIVVERSQDGDNRISGLVTLQRGILTAEVQHLRRTHVKLTNRMNRAATVYVRHAASEGYSFTKAPEHFEKVGTAYLFAVPLGAGETRSIEIEEGTPTERTLDLGSPTGIAMITAYLEQDGKGEAFAAQMKQLLTVHREVVDTESRIENLRLRLQDYRGRMDELHVQIMSLQAVKTGGELMRHLKTKMQEISDRVQRATIEVVNAEEALMLARIRFQDGIAELSIEKRDPKGPAGQGAAVQVGDAGPAAQSRAKR